MNIKLFENTFAHKKKEKKNYFLGQFYDLARV